MSFYQHSVAVKANENRRSYGVAGLRLMLCANCLKMSQTVNLVASQWVKLASEFLSPEPDVHKNQSTDQARVWKQHEHSESTIEGRKSGTTGDRRGHCIRSRLCRNLDGRELEQLRKLDFT